jgi:hypothetical protein
LAKRRASASTASTGKKGGTPADPSWHEKWLKVFAEFGVIGTACKAVGVDRSTAYNHREQFPDFAEAWDQAREDAADLFEEELRRRAIEGVVKPVYYEGRRVDDGTIKTYSDTLLIFRLKALRPEVYREHFDHRISGPGGGALQINIVPAKMPKPKADEGGDA